MCKNARKFLSSRAISAAAWSVLCLTGISSLPAPANPPHPQVPGGLAVTLVSPQPDAFVGGEVFVCANVSPADILVAGVRFQLDGADLGAEDTDPPFAIYWDSTTTADGAHTLTAIARDAAGNRSTSATLRVTVSNGPSPDRVPPTVGITSPRPGATLSGRNEVTAEAADNVGVAGVRFQLDGAPLGEEDTSAPFAVSWDTASSSDGTHILTAIARDAARNIRTSAPVEVTVANGPSPDRTPPAVEIISPRPGATLSGRIQVTAKAVDDVGVAGVRFQLDGAPLGEEDASAPFAVTWDTASAGDGNHVLTAIARDAAGNLAESPSVSITVDNGTPPDPTASRFEETDPSIGFSGEWIHGNSDRPWSGGTASFSTAASARATIRFKGRSVAWIGARGPHGGIARIHLDGSFLAEVDSFADSEEIQAKLFETRELADADHTLVIESTGRARPGALGAAIVVDAFDVSSSLPAPPGERLQNDPAPPPRRTGDSNWDCEIDLTDAILILEYLFLGGVEQACPAASDVNQDGEIDIADPAALLIHLFEGGPAPSPADLFEGAAGALACAKTGCRVRSSLAARGAAHVWIHLLDALPPAELAARLEGRFRVEGHGISGAGCPLTAEPCDLLILGRSNPMPATVGEAAVLDALEAMSEVGRIDPIRTDLSDGGF